MKGAGAELKAVAVNATTNDVRMDFKLHGDFTNCKFLLAEHALESGFFDDVFQAVAGREFFPRSSFPFRSFFNAEPACFFLNGVPGFIRQSRGDFLFRRLRVKLLEFFSFFFGPPNDTHSFEALTFLLTWL
jgi:hypothetical protein